MTSPHDRRRLFLSYAGPDRERALGLKLVLELAGAEVFMDFGSIPPGAAWEKVLGDALEACDVLCVLWTREASQAEWVRREYTTFMARHPDRLCVPLCADETPLRAPLSTRQAPPEFLALANELLTINRTLIRQGVSPAERARVTRERLAKRGVTLDDLQTQRVLALVGAGMGGFSLAYALQLASQPWVLPSITGVAAIAAIAALLTIPGEPPPIPPKRALRPTSAATPLPNAQQNHDSPSVPAPPAALYPATGGVRQWPSTASAAHEPAVRPPGRQSPPAPTDTAQLQCFDWAPIPPSWFIEPSGVAPNGPFCRYLDTLLIGSQRYFVDFLTGLPWTEEEGEKRTVTFPICGHQPFVHWSSGWRPSPAYSCKVFRPNLRSMNHSCAQSMPPDAAALAAFDVLLAAMNSCLPESMGWKSHGDDRPSLDDSGVLILYGNQRNGHAGRDFYRYVLTRRLSLSIALTASEHIEWTDAFHKERRAQSAVLSLTAYSSTR